MGPIDERRPLVKKHAQNSPDISTTFLGPQKEECLGKL
ncbi:MAG: hypothetical protein RLZZ627_484 [Pseudomonadota bacterium]